LVEQHLISLKRGPSACPRHRDRRAALASPGRGSYSQSLAKNLGWLMLFWVLCAVLTATVLYAVTRPLTLPAAASSAVDADTASDLAVYRDQLAELEADRARGLLSDSEFEAARVEISRRLLARAD